MEASSFFSRGAVELGMFPPQAERGVAREARHAEDVATEDMPLTYPIRAPYAGR